MYCLILIAVLALVILFCQREHFGRGGPELDFLPTVGEFPTGDDGYIDEEAIPF